MQSFGPAHVYLLHCTYLLPLKLYKCSNSCSLSLQVSAEEGKRSVAKVRRVSQVSPLLRQGKFVKPPENSSSVADSGRTVTDLSKTTRLAIENQVNLLTKHRSRRKIDLQKALAWKDFKSNDMGDNCPHKYSYAVNRIVEPKVFIFYVLVKVVFLMIF